MMKKIKYITLSLLTLGMVACENELVEMHKSTLEYLA